MEMEKISTHNISRDGAESIQWNWKLIASSNASFIVSGSRIHSMELKEESTYTPETLAEKLTQESIQWNWKRCHPELWRVKYIHAIRIHSMELKGVQQQEWVAGGVGRHRNPFNGIERYHLHHHLLRYFVPHENPFNGIERDIISSISSILPDDIWGIHSMELKVDGVTPSDLPP